MTAHFDQYAADYDAALARGVSISGEDKEFFARGRITWAAEWLQRLGQTPRVVLDFGCGTGTAARHLLELINADSVIGTDTSTKSIEAARSQCEDPRVSFLPLHEYWGSGEIDLAYCNGVFHHSHPDERLGAVKRIWSALRPGGLLAFFENNPWNPAHASS